MFSCYSHKRSAIDLSKQNDTYKLIYYASLAASSHNTQPWKVTVSNQGLCIEPDWERKLHVVDPNARELYISLGAFVENMEIAANNLGYTLTINYKKATDEKSVCIWVTLKQENVNKLPINDLIARRILRTPYDSVSIADSLIQRLTNNNKATVYFLSANSAKGKYIKQQTIEAYTAQAHNQKAQEELAKWLRFSNIEASKHNDGLTPSGMEINGLAGFIVRNFFKPEDSKSASFIKSGIENTKKQVEGCGGWLVVCQSSNKPEDYINTGRAIERINIICHQLNLGFHPMTQMIEETAFEKEANDYLNLGGTIQFVARIGYIQKYPSPVSVRRSVEEFTTFKK